MTEVLDEVVDTAEVGRPRRDRDETRLVDPEMVDQLIEQAREQGVDVAGQGWAVRAAGQDGAGAVAGG
jgi:hypothetical protein